MNSATSSKSALSEATVVFASKLWIAIAGIAMQGVLAWYLGPADRGAYAVCLMFATVLGVLFSFGADRGAQYSIMSGRATVSSGLWSMILIVGLGSGLAMIAGLLLMRLPLELFDKADSSSFRLAIVLIPPVIFMTGFRLQMAGLRQFVSLAIVDVVRTTLNLALVFVLLGLYRAGPDGALVAQLVCVALAIAMLVAYLWRRCGFSFAGTTWADAKSIVDYGRKYYVARIGHVIDAGLGTLLLAFFATREELGLFAAASALVLNILMVADSVETVLLPRVAADSDGRPELVARVARASAIVTTSIVILLVIVSEPLVDILLSPSFAGVVALILWLAPGVCLQGFNTILMSYFRGSNQPKICSVAVWAGLTANAVGIAVLYPEFGVAGAAMAMSVGFAARTFVLVIAFKRATRISTVELCLPGLEDFKLASGAFKSGSRRNPGRNGAS